MAISYPEAIAIIRKHASEHREDFARQVDEVAVEEAMGRICSQDYHSPTSTPSFDTSAMDGFAVNSEATASASPSTPLVLCVHGTMAAGDAPLLLDAKSIDGYLSCTEIMTGAQFPTSTTNGLPFDACIKIEDTIAVRPAGKSGHYVQIQKSASRNQNRRFAGNDFKLGQLVMPAGTTVKPQHVMALASLGIKQINVYRRLSVSVMSTGSELNSSQQVRTQNCIYDSNRPYVMAVLAGLGVNVIDLGIMKDDPAEFENYLSNKLAESQFDVVITTGAVSKGKFDFVRAGLESIGAKVSFHHVAVRPGHPILFATLPSPDRKASTVFFGLPGNPLAAAACLRFFVVPYLTTLHGKEPEMSTLARLCTTTKREDQRKPVKPKSSFTDTRHVFSHGKLSVGMHGTTVALSADQGSSKVSPLLNANCWTSTSAHKDFADDGESVHTFPLHLSSLGD